MQHIAAVHITFMQQVRQGKVKLWPPVQLQEVRVSSPPNQSIKKKGASNLPAPTLQAAADGRASTVVVGVQRRTVQERKIGGLWGSCAGMFTGRY